MERFPFHLDARKLDGHNWILLSDFMYITKADRNIKVPAGTKTDLASTPWFARWAVSVDGQHTKPAVVHDYLYGTGLVSRKEADDIFLEAMEVRGVAWYKRNMIYWSVRLGGAANYTARNSTT